MCCMQGFNLCFAWLIECVCVFPIAQAPDDDDGRVPRGGVGVHALARAVCEINIATVYDEVRCD
jgi:hypothetical protein